MDAPRAAAPSPLAIDEVQLVLDHLDWKLSRPLVAFRDGLGRLDVPPDADRPESIRTMEFVCDDLIGLTAEFRDYLTLVLGRQAPIAAPMRLSSLLAEIERRLAPRAASRSQAWACALEDSDATVVIDAELCIEVLVQLATNAILYAPEAASVRVTARSLGGAVRLSVADNGAGIPEAHRERMFQPFERLASSVQGEIPGAGLGLARCRLAVERMGGTIAIEIPPGGGTRVVVELPGTA